MNLGYYLLLFDQTIRHMAENFKFLINIYISSTRNNIQLILQHILQPKPLQTNLHYFFIFFIFISNFFALIQYIYHNMILEIFVTSLLLFVLLTIHYCWIKPRRIMNFYQNQLKNMKCRSKVIPYKLFYNRFSQPLQEGKKLGDPMIHYKNQSPQYDIIVSNIMNTPYLEIMGTDFMRQFFTLDKHYEYPKISIIINQFKRLFGPGLGFSQEHVWKEKRNLLNKLFNFDFVKNQTPNIVKICDRCITQMEQKATKGVNEFGPYVQCHLLHDLLMDIFSQVIISGFIGLNEKHYIEGIEVTKYLLSIIEDIGQQRIISPTVILGNRFYDMELRKIDKSINSRQKKLEQWGHKIVAEQLRKVQIQMEQKGKQMKIDNVIKTFLVYKKQNATDDIFSYKDIFAQFLGFIFAGTDTTSNFLNVSLFYIAKNPEVEKLLRKQIDQNLKNDDYSYQNLRNFKYIDAIQKQTTRIYGPINNLSPRQANCDNYLNGLAIKKGTIVTINFIGNHYSEKHFKEPFLFRPQRWINGQCDNLDPYALNGFSGGARTCLGKHLSLLEAKIALIKIMKRYKKITPLKQNFKWDIKLFSFPEDFQTRLTINEENQNQ